MHLACAMDGVRDESDSELTGWQEAEKVLLHPLNFVGRQINELEIVRGCE